jgi:hypothetical protein
VGFDQCSRLRLRELATGHHATELCLGGLSLLFDDELPATGGALDRQVRTGLYCIYEPDDGDDIRWMVQS